MSGSFSVSIIRDDDKRVFAGKYFEDQGITTDWCGSLESLAPPVPTTPKPVLDASPPRVTALSWTGPIGAAVPLRAKVVDNLPRRGHGHVHRQANHPPRQVGDDQGQGRRLRRKGDVASTRRRRGNPVRLRPGDRCGRQHECAELRVHPDRLSPDRHSPETSPT